MRKSVSVGNFFNLDNTLSKNMNQLNQLNQLNKSNSDPLLSSIEGTDFDIHDIKTSEGKPMVEKIFAIELEGDGPLGINFGYNKKTRQMYVVTITENTLSAEFELLEPDLIVLRINGHNVRSSTFEENLSRIKYIWKRQRVITIEFKKTCELTENTHKVDPDFHINTVLYEILRKMKCEYYYNDFVRLGAKNIDDFEFVEYTDLVEMNMSQSQIKEFCVTFNLDIPEKDKKSGIFEVPSDPNICDSDQSLITDE